MYVSKFNVGDKQGIKVKDAEARESINELSDDIVAVQSSMNSMRMSIESEINDVDRKATENGVEITNLKSRVKATEDDIYSLEDEADGLARDININSNGIVRNDAGLRILEARMDNFTRLEEGSTTGDAELEDARVGIDGVTYSNAGGAIRSQVLNADDGMKSSFSIERPRPEGDYTLAVGTINGSTGTNSQNTARVRTAYHLNQVHPMLVRMTDNTYSYSVYGYTTDMESYVRKISPDFVIGSYPTAIPDDIGAIRIVFKLASDETDEHEMTDSDIAAIKEKLYLSYNVDAYAVNAAMEQNFTSEQKQVARTNIDAASNTIFDSRTSYAIDPSTLGYSYGGLRIDNGYSNEDKNRLRYLAPDGKGAILVGAGSTIASNTGYKFNIALYEKYVSNSNFELIGGVHMMTGTYTIDQDCYARISFGRTDDADLWSIVNGVRTLNAYGEEAVTDALTLNLIGATVKQKIAELEAGMPNKEVVEVGSIPIDADSYYALWDEMLTSGFVTKSELGKINNDPSLAVNLYRLNTDMGHVDGNYNVVDWNGSNSLYTKPKVLITSGVHGNERATPMAVFEFVNNLFSNPYYQELRNLFDWYFIPMVNPWGFSHTALLNGNVTDGFGLPLSNYTIVENTSEYHQGIRYNSTGADPNRDFNTQAEQSATREAQLVRDAVSQILGANEEFAFTLDCHMAPINNNKDAGAFLSVAYNTPANVANDTFRKWMQAGARTEVAMSNYKEVPLIQSVFPWAGTNLQTMRNYMYQFTDNAMCFEGDQTCTYYSGSKVYSNPVASTFVATQLHNFLDRFCSFWK